MKLEILKLKSKPTDDFVTNRKLTLSGFNISALETILNVARRTISEKMMIDNLDLPDDSYVVITIACYYGRVDFLFGNAKAMPTHSLMCARMKKCHYKLNKTTKGELSDSTSIIDHDIGFAATITGCRILGRILKQQNILTLLLTETKRRWIS
jgi:hypothetical protein